MNFFISNAHAAPAIAGAEGEFTQLIFMLVVFGAIFYFLLYRPQAKRMKEHKDLVTSIAKNDEVLTQGGIVGKVAKISDDKDFIVVAFNENNEVVVQKSAITAVLPKGTIKSL
jgi:preprotein translocase subunit YajC